MECNTNYIYAGFEEVFMFRLSTEDWSFQDKLVLELYSLEGDYSEKVVGWF